MINERLKLNRWTVNYKQVIYFTFNFRRSFIINSRAFMQECVYTSFLLPSYVINRLKMTEQTAHVLGTEIVARLFPPIAEDNNE